MGFLCLLKRTHLQSQVEPVSLAGMLLLIAGRLHATTVITVGVYVIDRKNVGEDQHYFRSTLPGYIARSSDGVSLSAGTNKVQAVQNL